MGKVNRPPSKYKATRRPMPDFREHRERLDKAFARSTARRENGCLEWTAWKNRLGYGQVYWNYKNWSAPRVMYCMHHGPFNEWLDVRHSCDNPACVAIEHLSIGTRSDNMRDAVDRKRSKNAKKTHCPKGHPYAENACEFVPGTATSYKPWRHCKVCMRARGRIKLGWPEDLAYSLPPQPLGHRPPEVRARESSNNG